MSLFMSDYVKRGLVHASREMERVITPEMVYDRSRRRLNVHARWYLMAYMRAFDRFSLPRIAWALKQKDHTTVLHGLRCAHGHDGKLLHKYEPLWTKEHFEKIAAEDALILDELALIRESEAQGQPVLIAPEPQPLTAGA